MKPTLVQSSNCRLLGLPCLKLVGAATLRKMQTCIPLPLDDNTLEEIAQKGKDYALIHGIGMRTRDKYSPDGLWFAPFTLLPSIVSKTEFEKAVKVQVVMNKLMHRVAYSHDFLSSALKATIQVDDFTRRLYDVYETVRKEGVKQRGSLGLFRSDYLSNGGNGDDQGLKQVEFNTIAASFGTLSVEIRGAHGYILEELGHADKVEKLPENGALQKMCSGIARAWVNFGDPKGIVLFIVEDVSYNICDQRMMEYEVRRQVPGIKILRRSIAQLSESATLVDGNLVVEGHRVSLVYMRAGYDPSHYRGDEDWALRLLIEKSSAIKCPSIQYHLAGTKKVQQVLSGPGVLESLLDSPEEVAAVRDMFTNLYSLDSGPEGEKGIELALSQPERYVLKPQREGGGNNVYGAAVAEEVKRLQAEGQLSGWVLMERLRPRPRTNYILRPHCRPVLGQVVSELGVFGIVLSSAQGILINEVAGHMLRSKQSNVDEGGVAAGLGALDSPYLI